jgi:hypothetical protein
MSNKQETKNLLSIDEILSNLKKNKNFYSTGMSEDMWMQECQREDAL